MRATVFLIIVAVLIYSCNPKPVTLKPTLGQMTESVYASVTVVPEDIYDVYAAVTGILEKVYIKEGDTVLADQNLALIQSTNPTINIDNARLGVDIARERLKGATNILDNISAEIDAARKQCELDSTNYFRQLHLWNQTIGAKSDLDQKKLKYELSQNNLHVLLKRYDQTVIDLQNNYNQSQNDLRRAQSNLKDYNIKSKIDGTIYRLFKEEGEIISNQEPFAQIGKTDSFFLEMLIDEVDITRVKPGQLALVSLDAYEKEVFEATISKVYPLKDNRTQTFRVEGKFNNPPGILYAGLSGEVNIVLSIKDNVMTIPMDYLLQGDKVKTEEREIKVEVGLKNLNYVEIISGIDTSTVLIKP